MIIAKGPESYTGLFDEPKAAGLDAHMIGDCKGVGYNLSSVRHAAHVAAAIRGMTGRSMTLLKNGNDSNEIQ